MSRRWMTALVPVCITLCLLLFVPPALPCPFCPSLQGNTLIRDVQQSSFVVFGKAKNPRLLRAADGSEYGLTDFDISEVLKSHKLIEKKKTITLNKYLVLVNEGEDWLIFGDVYSDKLDVFRGNVCKDGILPKYLKGALALDEKDAPKRLRYFFEYLDSPDAEIASDSYREFASAEYTDVIKMVKLPGGDKLRQRVLTWIKDPNTQPYRLGLYSLILGLTGTADDGPTFLDILNDPERKFISGIDGLLAGYILCDPKNGWEYITKITSDPKLEHSRRYAALRALHFFIESHQGKFTKEQLGDCAAIMLDDSEMCDLTADYLVKWKDWRFTKKVLSMTTRFEKPSVLLERAAIRYAFADVETNNNPDSISYLANQKAKNPVNYKDMEEVYRMEKQAALPPVGPPASNNTPPAPGK